MYGMSHACDKCLLMVNSPLKGNILSHRYLFQTILSSSWGSSHLKSQIPTEVLSNLWKRWHQGWRIRLTLIFNIALVNTCPWWRLKGRGAALRLDRVQVYQLYRLLELWISTLFYCLIPVFCTKLWSLKHFHVSMAIILTPSLPTAAGGIPALHVRFCKPNRKL